MSNAIDPTKTTNQLEERQGTHWNKIILWNKRQKIYRANTKNRAHSGITMIRRNYCSTKTQKPCATINTHTKEPSKEAVLLTEHKFCMTEVRLLRVFFVFVKGLGLHIIRRREPPKRSLFLGTYQIFHIKSRKSKRGV